MADHFKQKLDEILNASPRVSTSPAQTNTSDYVGRTLYIVFLAGIGVGMCAALLMTRCKVVKKYHEK